MKKLFFILCVGGSLAANAQVGIGTTSPDAGAILDLSSNSKGILIPRMTSGERTGISSPATGLMVYDTNVNQFYYYNGTAWVQAIGPQGIAGTNGKTILSGNGAPSPGLGTIGDFYLDNPNARFYGPKTAGGWGSGISLIGAQGPQGPSGVLNYFPLTFNDPGEGVALIKMGDWHMYPLAQVALPAGGALVNLSTSVRTSEMPNLQIGCNICYSASPTPPSAGTPIMVAGSAINLTQRLGPNFEVVAVSGKVSPPLAGTYWIGPCFLSTTENLFIKAVMGYGIVIQ